jgi:hypothetical protein
MIEIQFDVNNAILRNEYFTVTLPQAISSIDKNTPPLWGKMNAHQMIEHLNWTFEIATGKIIVEYKTPERLLPRVKTFLHSNTETPHDFKNPLIGDNPLPLRYSNFLEAKTKLLEEVKSFVEHFKTKPDAVYTHPIFGPIENDEWERANYKHCYHHLAQFGLTNIHRSETIS